MMGVMRLLNNRRQVDAGPYFGGRRWESGAMRRAATITDVVLDLADGTRVSFDPDFLARSVHQGEYLTLHLNRLPGEPL